MFFFISTQSSGYDLSKSLRMKCKARFCNCSTLYSCSLLPNYQITGEYDRFDNLLLISGINNLFLMWIQDHEQYISHFMLRTFKNLPRAMILFVVVYRCHVFGRHHQDPSWSRSATRVLDENTDEYDE